MDGQRVGGVPQQTSQPPQLRQIRGVVKIPIQGGDAGGVQLGLQPAEIRQEGIQLALTARRLKVIAEPEPGVGVGQLVGNIPGVDKAGVCLLYRCRTETLGQVAAKHVMKAEKAL